MAKQAGRKRRSRSGERSRSPKRQAASPATRKSGESTTYLLHSMCWLVLLASVAHTGISGWSRTCLRVMKWVFAVTAC